MAANGSVGVATGRLTGGRTGRTLVNTERNEITIDPDTQRF